jgi:hypothetical protein
MVARPQIFRGERGWLFRQLVHLLRYVIQVQLVTAAELGVIDGDDNTGTGAPNFPLGKNLGGLCQLSSIVL